MNDNEYFETIKQYKLMAEKEIGQNLLIDKEISKRIVDLLDLKPSDWVLEIGAGAGSLSYYLAQTGAEVDFVDIDERMISKLKKDFADVKTVRTCVKNALEMDLSPYNKIISNMPYYITNSLLEKILIEGFNLEKVVLMLQKEAFGRVYSKPGEPDYGPLSILANKRGIIKKEFLVKPTSFAPRPHVDSLVFTIEFQDRSDLKDFYKFLKSGFLHRRKTISNNLSKIFNDPTLIKKTLQELGINETTRPEDIKQEDWMRLFSVLKAA